MAIGRLEIFTDAPVVNEKNIIPILQKAMPKHMINASRCTFLLNYEAGEQPIKREKKYRADINEQCVDNIANEVTEFKLGFNWGNPITLVQRGESDSGTKDEPLSISLLNECYEAEKIKTKTQQLARFIEICGIGYTFVEQNREYQKKKQKFLDRIKGLFKKKKRIRNSFFNVNVLDPRTAFVIKSSYYIDHRPMVGVSFRKDDRGDYHFTCFTEDRRYEIINLSKIVDGQRIEEVERDWKDKDRWSHEEERQSGVLNDIGMIPIVEWIRSYDRMGCFERQIPEMDNLNLLVSDFTNDVDQNTQAIWHGNDVEFPKDNDGNEQHPKTNDWMITQTTQDGKTPFVKPLAIEYDYPGMLQNIITRRALILQKCNVPSRNDNSGGSTGIAMDSATGWNAAETAASKQQMITESCKMQEVEIALAVIQNSQDVPQDSPLLELDPMDVQPSIKRSKNYELTTKVNFFATAVSHGIYGLHALKAMDAFEDINQVWADSKSLIEAYQKSVFEKSNSNKAEGGEGERKPNSGRLEQDNSDQIQNSPMLDSDRS